MTDAPVLGSFDPVESKGLLKVMNARRPRALGWLLASLLADTNLIILVLATRSTPAHVVAFGLWLYCFALWFVAQRRWGRAIKALRWYLDTHPVGGVRR